MSYTVVGMFPNNKDLNMVANQLSSAGFTKDDYRISRYTVSENFDQNQYNEDEKTSGFWNWLFGDNEDDRNKYSYAGSKNNIVTVYANDLHEAERARNILDVVGAIDINNFNKDRYPNTESSQKSHELTEAERSRIINKAKHNLYITDENRYYETRRDGMESDMDSQGSKNDL